MKKIRPFIYLSLILWIFSFQTTFLAEQKKFERVRRAFSEKESSVKISLANNGLQIDNFHLLIVAYKDSDDFELYVRKKDAVQYSLLKSYSICSRSGELGPKRKIGDGQVPEGFYHIDRFNPTSNFYLSLGISYPNVSDRKKSKAANLGGDIFIHGSCVTIGCIPMTDDIIKEIYLYAILAKNNGQSKIPVYIFPFRMTTQNMTSYQTEYKDKKELLAFWQNLKTGYDKFTQDKKDLNVSVLENGDYSFK